VPTNSYGFTYPAGTDAADGVTAVKNAVDTIGPYTNMRFANAAARDALLTVPLQGMACWLQDVNTWTYYNGTAWLPLGGDTQTYTPAWTAVTTNPVLGNGTLTGRYVQIGKWVHLSIDLVMGSTTTYGSGSYSFSLPVNARTSSRIGVPGMLTDSSAGARYMLYGYWAGPSSTMALTYHGVVGANVQSLGISQGTPVTLANTDTMIFQGTYEAA
jgi:hypothetical protein